MFLMNAEILHDKTCLENQLSYQYANPLELMNMSIVAPFRVTTQWYVL